MYFQFQAGYADAAKDCEANGDTLLYMETREEVENVTKWLQDSDDTGSLYWVGGRYDVRSSDFKWDNGVPLSPTAPWGAGQPKDRKANTRVATSTVGREIELKTQASTAATRYICEGQRADDGDEEQIPIPCFKDNDLVIVVDSSGSIADEHYAIAKEFTTRLATTWIDHAGSRVSVLIYSATAESIFGLTDDQGVQAIKDKVYNMPHMKGSTNSHLGIDLAVAELENNKRNVLENMVFLTDGGSSNKAATKVSAEQATSLGVRTYSVGIGGSVDENELLVIAGGVQDHVFKPTQFDELLAVLRPLSIKVCE